MTENMTVEIGGKEVVFRRSIPYTDYCAGVEAVANTVVSDKDGYRAQTQDISIFMTMMRLYAIGYENLNVEDAWALLSECEDIYPGVYEANRFCMDCERAIGYRRTRSPLHTLVNLAMDALTNMSNDNPEMFADVAKSLMEIAASNGSDKA